jgi:Flp pilus assembly secretin CpaC
MRASLTVALTLTFSAALLSAAPALAENVVVPIDHSVRLALQGQAASVVVGNPQVADVTVVDSHTLFISGRGYGGTDVVVLDHSGRTIYSGEVTVASGGGQVSIYRGQARTDMACAPGCSVTTRSPTDAAKGGEAPSGGGAPSSNPIANLLGAAIGGAASAGAAASKSVTSMVSSPS